MFYIFNFNPLFDKETSSDMNNIVIEIVAKNKKQSLKEFVEITFNEKNIVSSIPDLKNVIRKFLINLIENDDNEIKGKKNIEKYENNLSQIKDKYEKIEDKNNENNMVDFFSSNNELFLNLLSIKIKNSHWIKMEEQKINEESTNKNIKSVGRPKKVTEKNIPIEKKSRGRPKKEKKKETSQKNGENSEKVIKKEEVPKKSRGRPKNPIKEIENKPQKIIEEKKGRGRPKKEILIKPTEEVQKKQRGRPKKIKVENELQKEELPKK